jgi:16S rRNA (guanine527-N7)-methyltransferase
LLIRSFPVLAKYQRSFGFELDSTMVGRLESYRDLLLAWNRKFNLTRVTDPEEIETRLFLDALAIIPLVRSVKGGTGSTRPLKIVDIGAGAGFPGLPLKIAMPEIDLVLIEATAKKVGFLQEIIPELGLAGTTAVHGRAEELAHDSQFRSTFDVVTARAVARLPALIEICMPFARVGGRGIFPKGPEIEEEVASAAAAARQIRCKIVDQVHPEIPELAGTSFVVVQQTGAPPGRFPRRAGIPAKDPL